MSGDGLEGAWSILVAQTPDCFNPLMSGDGLEE